MLEGDRRLRENIEKVDRSLGAQIDQLVIAIGDFIRRLSPHAAPSALARPMPGRVVDGRVSL